MPGKCKLAIFIRSEKETFLRLSRLFVPRLVGAKHGEKQVLRAVEQIAENLEKIHSVTSDQRLWSQIGTSEAAFFIDAVLLVLKKKEIEDGLGCSSKDRKQILKFQRKAASMLEGLRESRGRMFQLFPFVSESQVRLLETSLQYFAFFAQPSDHLTSSAAEIEVRVPQAIVLALQFSQINFKNEDVYLLSSALRTTHLVDPDSIKRSFRRKKKRLTPVALFGKNLDSFLLLPGPSAQLRYPKGTEVYNRAYDGYTENVYQFILRHQKRRGIFDK